MVSRILKIGDIAEIKTPRGLAYIQYTHASEHAGELIRVLPGLYTSRPASFFELASQKELYFIFYPLTYALRAKQTEIVSNQPVPEWARNEPIMRQPVGTEPEGKTSSWKLVPALQPLTVEFLRETPVIHELSPEQRKLSILIVRGHASMVKEIARGWTPDRAESFGDKDRAQARANRASQPIASHPVNPTMRHYFYFSSRTNAEGAGSRLRESGYSVEVRESKTGTNWLALATADSSTIGGEIEQLRASFEALASQFSGEYDGWEVATNSTDFENLDQGMKVN